MKVNCDYCGSFIEATDEQCPNCGGVNTHFVRTASDTPQTIDELRAYCAKNNLPLDRMHVHIAEDYKAPKAFGIYKDDSTGHFVVYKNKANGQRAIRYEGTDEAYAVNEIYMKIKDLVMDAREHASTQNNRRTSSRPAPKKKSFLSSLFSVIIVIITIGVIFAGIVASIRESSKNGYYNYDGNTYYRHGSYWYMYDDDLGEWDRADNMESYVDEDDFAGKSYDDDSDYEKFPTSDFSDDWSTDDDWDSSDDGSWNDSYDSYDYDSGDWDSDW